MSTMRANFAFDNPVFDKASMLGGKTDMQNKKMIKYGIIAMGFACGGIVLWLLMRVSLLIIFISLMIFFL